MPRAAIRAATVVVGEAGYVTGLTSYSWPTRVMVRMLRSLFHSSSEMVKAKLDCVMSPRLMSLYRSRPSLVSASIAR